MIPVFKKALMYVKRCSIRKPAKTAAYDEQKYFLVKQITNKRNFYLKFLDFNGLTDYNNRHSQSAY